MVDDNVILFSRSLFFSRDKAYETVQIQFHFFLMKKQDRLENEHRASSTRPIYLKPGTVQNHNRTVLDWLGGRIVPLDTFSRLNHYLRLFLGKLVVLGDFEVLLGQEASTNRAVRH
ncbi:hypothetical protein PUN28_007234 [Cardiocondyla obscurior]|uniref:Uncharacterized protein n=1 Tax=Cardiocondyla obscurior TaxID=286306 RepID=A0AAW2G2H1_9HYME